MTTTLYKTARESDKFVVRLPHGMRDKISWSAEKGCRSMNADIIYRLSRSLAAEADAPKQGQSNVLSPVEMSLLKGFREMPKSRRQALLLLLSDS